MEPPTSPTRPGRQPTAIYQKIAIIACWAAMAAGAIAVTAAGHRSPAALATLLSAITALAAAFGVLYWGVTKLARDARYSLSAKAMTIMLALVAASILLTFWSTTL